MGILNRFPFALKIRQGLAAALSATATTSTAETGEPHWTTDVKDLWIFDGTNMIYIGGATLYAVVTPEAGNKLGFFGATPIVQPANTVAINDVLVNLGLRASGGVSNFTTFVRSSTATYRRYYHIAPQKLNPGAAGATWVNPNANLTGGWNLTLSTHTLIMEADVHADWDGASDMVVEVRFALNAAGSAGDTVDLKLVPYYNGVGDSATKTQTVAESVTVTDGTQYKVYMATFTLDWDAVSNNIEVGDEITMILNMETDTSEIDNIVITGATFYYNTTHVGVESGDV